MKKTIWTVALLSLLSIEAFAGVRFIGAAGEMNYGGSVSMPEAKCNMTYHEKRKYYMDMKRYAKATNDSWAYYFLSMVKIHGHDYRYTTLSCAKRYMQQAVDNAEHSDWSFFAGRNYQLKRTESLEEAQRVISWEEPGGDYCPAPTVEQVEEEPTTSRPPLDKSKWGKR